jgi:hypothetical protein
MSPRRTSLLVSVAMLVIASPSLAQDLAVEPSEGLLADVPETVYEPVPIRQPGSGFNDGAVSLDIGVIYRTDYVFRGIEPVEPDSGEDAANVGIDGTITFDLGRLPDPFVRLFTNTAEGDQISKFQVIRPTVGLRFDSEVLDVVVAHQSFTYPDRDVLDTSEVYVEVDFNDALLSGDEGKFIGPYAFVAYDYDTFEGIYAEAGFRRSGRQPGSALLVGYDLHIAYVDGLEELFGDDGFAHYQFGVHAEYDLNTLLNISRRYGRFSLVGELHYTDEIDDEVAAETQIWGGGGLMLRY